MSILYEQDDSFMDGKRERRPNAEKLRGLCWVTHALAVSGMPATEFVTTYVQRGESALRSFYRWKAGDVTPAESLVRKIESRLTGSAWPYLLPLFSLLAPHRLALAKVRSLVKDYERLENSRFIPWRFPNDDELIASKRFVATIVQDDTQSLVSRGDVYGFIAILALVREAHARRRSDLFGRRCPDLFRALPAVARLPWMYPHRALLYECMNSIYGLEWNALFQFRVDWAVIDRQVEALIHETIREYRPRDPVTKRFLDLEDPIIYPRFVKPRRIRTPPQEAAAGKSDPV